VSSGSRARRTTPERQLRISSPRRREKAKSTIGGPTPRLGSSRTCDLPGGPRRATTTASPATPMRCSRPGERAARYARARSREGNRALKPGRPAGHHLTSRILYDGTLRVGFHPGGAPPGSPSIPTPARPLAGTGSSGAARQGRRIGGGGPRSSRHRHLHVISMPAGRKTGGSGRPGQTSIALCSHRRNRDDADECRRGRHAKPLAVVPRSGLRQIRAGLLGGGVNDRSDGKYEPAA